MSRRARLPALVLAVALALSALPGPIATASAQDGTTLVYEGETLAVEAGPGQPVAGQTDLPAGTEVTVRLRSTGGNPFLKTSRAVVDSDGRFRAVLAFDDVPAGTTFDVAVHGGEGRLATAEGEVVECEESCEGGAAVDGSAFDAGEDGTLAVEAGPGRAVRGTAAVPAGTRVSVRLQSTGENPFLMTAETVVDSDGRFRAVLDLSDVRAGTTFEAVVHHDGTTLAAANGTVVECETDCAPPAGGDETPAGGPVTPSGDELAVQSVVSVDQGDVARIAVGLGDAEAATLSVGGPGVNFVSNVTVRDGDGDGLVAVLFDTAAAGHPERTALAADEDDSARVHDGEETRLNPSQWALDAGDYPTALYRGPDATGEAADAGTLVVRQVPESEREERTERDATATPWRGEELGFQHGIVTTDQGDLAHIPVGLGDAGVATVSLGDPAAGWWANVTVRDGDDEDSAVVLLLDTTAVGHGGQAFSAVDPGDSVSVEDGAWDGVDAENGSIPAGDYEFALFRGTNTEWELVDVGTLVVERGYLTGTVADTLGADATDGAGLLGGLGLLGVGGVLAVAGLALLLGVVRR